MPVYRKYILRMLIYGLVLCHSAAISAQQDPIETDNYGIELIDTSDYVPSFYEGSSGLNLMIAASRGYISEIDRLIRIGADINSTTNEGVTPLIYAVINNRYDAVKALLKYKPEIDKVTSDYQTPLLISVKNDSPDICEELIRAGADVDLPDRHGATPLHYAALYGYLDIADMLLYYNANIDQKSDEGVTPLLASIIAGFANVADLLVQNGANMETRNNDGDTPFLMAALNGDTLIMDLLYKHGVDIYTTNKENYTALDLAISANQTEAVNYLLKIGDKWNITSGNAVNPYLVAAKYRRKELIPLLKEHNVPGKIRYGIDQASVTISSRFTMKDYYTGFSMSLKEPFLNGGIIAGTDMKLWYTRVLVQNSENLFHQYFDKGYLAYAGVFKDFTLYENPFRSNILLSASLKAGYSFGHTMKGTLLFPANEFVMIPDVAIKWNIKNFSILTGMEYIKSQFYHIGPVWLRVGMSYTLFFDRIRTDVKPLKWY